VTLITGPVHLPTPDRVSRIDVVSARDMLAACEAAIPCDLFIASAAVADYRPEVVATQNSRKILRPATACCCKWCATRTSWPPSRGAPTARSVSASPPRPSTCSTTPRKLKDKNLDLIVANDVANPSIGFNSEENACSVIDRELHANLSPRPARARSPANWSLLSPNV
jgi:phosphopantothenoylcysteine decarboxylase/phosphopantothenate--cysteine ligase